VPDSSRWTRLSDAVLTGARKNAAPRYALGLAFALALAALIAPWRQPARFTVGSDDLDRVAPQAVVASHDFTYTRDDPAGVRAAREAASAQVVPVWDHDASLEHTIDGRIADAFADARSAIEAVGAERVRAEREADAPEGTGDEQAGSAPDAEAPPVDSEAGDVEAVDPVDPEEALARVPNDERVTIANELESVRALLAGAREPENVRLEAFARAGFSRQTEDALKNLVREAMSKHIVENAAALETIGAHGITLRTIRRGQPAGERRVRQLLSFGDLEHLDAVIAPARHHLFYIEDADVQDAIGRAAESLVVVNTRQNQRETTARVEAAMRQAEELHRASQTQTFREGQIIVDRGDVIDERALAIVSAMHASADDAPAAWMLILATVLVVALVLLPILTFAQLSLRRFTTDIKHLAMMGTVLVAQLAATRLGIFLSDLVSAQGTIPAEALYYLVPLAAGAMLVRILTNAESALVYSIAYALLAGVVFEFELTYSAAALVASVVGMLQVRDAHTRADIMRGALWVGVVVAALAVALLTLRSGGFGGDVGWVALGGGLSGLTSALFVYALLPIIESGFRYTTPLRLMELANLNHPALRELILKAPGSYHHSMMVGQLVEAACEAVGADALLGRVGSYFHDIGKMKNPGYFAENQRGTNPHDKLKPNVSAIVIKAHVTDGVELARRYRLPTEIVDFIREHHGTSLIRYFHQRAREQSGGDVIEADFRYPGPKPQSRETAICLLADGIEAASRSLADRSRENLERLVQKMVNAAFIDGQLDECELTLKDLDMISEAFKRRLMAFYHQRPEYPDEQRSSAVRRARQASESASAAAVPTETPHGDDRAPRRQEADEPGESQDVEDSVARHLRQLGM
jgi:putative nucleotidyltransferase with HDIG domain